MTAINLEYFQGSAVIVKSLVELFEDSLETVIEELNEAAAEQNEETANSAYEIKAPAQILPYIPMLSVLSGGLPIIGIGEMPSDFDDDLVSSLVGHHKVAVMAILSNSDHLTLTEQLRVYTRAIQLTVQQDRERPLHNEEQYLGGVKHGGSWYTRFLATEPGPLLAEVNPMDQNEPPATFLSWTGIALECTREEV